MVRGSREKNDRLRVGIVVGLLLALSVGLAGCASGRAVDGGLRAGDVMCPPTCSEPVTCRPCGAKTPPPCERPPQANPGEAWCQVWVPPVYCDEEKAVCVQPASTRQVLISAKYGMRPKVVCSAEAELREKIVPAVWNVKQREVMVCPPQDQWKRIYCPQVELGPCEKQCDCYTKVVRPGVYACENCPVCLAPERRCVTYKPAQYKVVQERFEAVPARWETLHIPAKYKMCRQKVCVQPGRWEWRRNEACEVPVQVVRIQAVPVQPLPAPLTALQFEMEDKAASGEPAGIFTVGDVVRYDLRIVSDGGSKALEGLKIVFTLPPELDFISGIGTGVKITGSGQAAETAPFVLPVGAEVALHVLCRVTAVPETNLTQLEATVLDAEGNVLATETESTTLKAAP